MRVDNEGRVSGFLEKPKTEQELSMVRTDTAWIESRGIPSRGRDCLGSMGIYIFKRDVLVDVLTKTDYRDFGKEIFPMSIRTHRVMAHLFDGYWEDIGTIKSFFQANIDLAKPNPPFELASAEAPIYSHARFLPPAKIEGATIRSSLIADGCQIAPGAVIENSVIGVRCRIGRNVTIRNSIVMGADIFQREAEMAADLASGTPAIGVGEGTTIEGAIVDKNCRIGRNIVISNPDSIENTPDSDQAVIRDGIVVLPKDAVLPDGWKFGGS
jgi:glucose-1-phosphate adenylyltransferase